MAATPASKFTTSGAEHRPRPRASWPANVRTTRKVGRHVSEKPSSPRIDLPPDGDAVKVDAASAVVTGGASGLGRATTEALVSAGAQVFAFDLPAAIESGEPVDGVTYIAADVTQPGDIRQGLEQVAAAPVPLRVLVNCAGIGPSMRILGKKGVHDLEVFAEVVQINLVGSFNTLALAAELIAEAPPLDDDARGVVVNTASIAAFEGQIGQAAYAASKGGIAALTLPGARDLAQYGIRVNTIAPGIVDTPMLATVSEEFRAGLASGVPFPKRLGKPEDFARLAMMLIEHDYLNGEIVRMDGALRMAPR